jgi:16S rRNA A1518/A1519 N6-dimethyltransferase RsmA/KsgA/DIM1 with predicted DNA glycosylase/AP lyase activity
MLLELGSGDGAVLLAAAKRGIWGVGYELNPLLVLISRWRLRNYPHTRVIWGNFWRQDWPEADGIFCFGLQKFMNKLDTKIVQKSKKPVKLASFAFRISDKKPASKKDGVYLYVYEAS